MPDYSKGKIYTLRYKGDENLIYVGSTIQSLSMRMAEHRRKHNSPIKRFGETNIDDWYIELYEEYPCENKELLCKREGEVIRQIGTINQRIEGRTKKEYLAENFEIVKQRKRRYREANVDIIKVKDKQKYERNRDKLIEQAKVRYEDNKEHITEVRKERLSCECGVIHNRGNKAQHIKSHRHQEYFKNKGIDINILKEQKEEERLQKRLQNRKLYYNENKYSILEYKKQKHSCECGGSYNNSNKNQHFRTQKHHNYLKNLILNREDEY